MGLIESLIRGIFGGDRNVIRETAEVFRVNAEAEAQRSHDARENALAQLAAEFSLPRKTWFDSLIDGLNRVPRPAMALGVIALFVSAMVDPVWFGERMSGLALVPEPLWWLLGAIVSFYFGARHQAKGQDFQREIAAGLSRMPTRPAPQPAATDPAEPAPQPPVRMARGEDSDTTSALTNPALAEWRRLQ